MQLELEFLPRYLRVVASGDFDLVEARGGLGRILHECQARGIDRVLIDARALTTQVSIADRYDLATQVASYGAGRMRMAILVARSNMFTKTLEDTAANRGAFVRTTDSLADAKTYLGISGE